MPTDGRRPTGTAARARRLTPERTDRPGSGYPRPLRGSVHRAKDPLFRGTPLPGRPPPHITRSHPPKIGSMYSSSTHHTSPTVAALYIDPRGPYPKMPDVDCWDESRDARTYEGPHPIVAHPPCGPWGELRHLYQGSEHACAPLAVDQVRRFGGVLEHPSRSKLWSALGLPEPGASPDEHGGFTVDVDQCAWGHVARKRTRLYFVRIDAGLVASTTRHGGAPTHWVCGSRNPRSGKSKGGVVPPGIKLCSAQQRRRTPPDFASWLVSMARAVDC
jgi:hypothetical protein